MKKLMAIILTLALVLSLAACGTGGGSILGGSNDRGNNQSDRNNDRGNDQGDRNNEADKDTPAPVIPNLPTIEENPVSDFEYKAIAGGVEITKYIGTSIRVRIPEKIEGVTVTSIGSSAFANMGIMEVHIPNGVTNIGSSAFSGNEALTTVVFPDSVTKLEHSVFAGCVSLPSELKERIQRLIYGDFEFIEFGGYSWLVLDKSGNTSLVLSLEIIESRAYHSTGGEITWEHSTIREYLNGEFYNNFSPADQNKIISTNIVNNNNPHHGTTGGNNTTDNIFLLSIDEASTYFTDNSSRIAVYANGEAGWWWLRSPGRSSGRAAYVNSDGGIYYFGNYVFLDLGVRPALWLNLPAGE